jgi:hypothetical protein
MGNTEIRYKNNVPNFSSRIVRRQCTKSSLAANCGSKSLHQIPRKFDVTIIIDSHFCFFFKNSIEGEQPNELQQATVTVISNAECNVAYEDIISITQQQFCAKADGIDTCQV